MSFDDLIGLLIFLLFVGVPLFNRIRRGSRNRPQQNPAQPRTPGRRAAPRTATDDPTPTAQAFDPDDPIGRRLEEARRRVEAARGSAPQQAATPPSGTASGSASATRAPQAPTQAPPPPQQASGPAPPLLPPTVYVDLPEPTTTFDRTAVSASEPLKVERRKRRNRSTGSVTSSSRMQPDELMRLDPDDIVRGILWHQILSEPVALRRGGRGRQPSPPPSR
jgi:hypothetical protein